MSDLRTENQKRQDAIRAEQDKQPLPTMKRQRRRYAGYASDRGRQYVWRGGATGDVERVK